MNPDEFPEGWRHIGDGVYARSDGFGIWTAVQRCNGWHSVYFEPATIRALNDFYANARAASAE